MPTFPDDFNCSVHQNVIGATHWTLHDSDGNMLYSVVGGGVGLYGDGVTTFEMYDSQIGEVVLQFADIEEINNYISGCNLPDGK